MSSLEFMTSLKKLVRERSKDKYWDFKGLIRALKGKADGFGRCPGCGHFNFLFEVSTGDDEGILCWPCWKG